MLIFTFPHAFLTEQEMFDELIGKPGSGPDVLKAMSSLVGGAREYFGPESSGTTFLRARARALKDEDNRQKRSCCTGKERCEELDSLSFPTQLKTNHSVTIYRLLRARPSGVIDTPSTPSLPSLVRPRLCIGKPPGHSAHAARHSNVGRRHGLDNGSTAALAGAPAPPGQRSAPKEGGTTPAKLCRKRGRFPSFGALFHTPPQQETTIGSLRRKVKELEVSRSLHPRDAVAMQREYQHMQRRLHAMEVRLLTLQAAGPFYPRIWQRLITSLLQTFLADYGMVWVGQDSSDDDEGEPAVEDDDGPHAGATTTVSTSTEGASVASNIATGDKRKSPPQEGDR